MEFKIFSLDPKKAVISMTVGTLTIIGLYIVFNVFQLLLAGTFANNEIRPYQVAEPADGIEYTNTEKGLAMFDAIYGSLDEEYNSLTWVPDNIIKKVPVLNLAFDNAEEFQIGVKRGMIKPAEAFAEDFTVLGKGEAREEGLLEATYSLFSGETNPVRTGLNYRDGLSEAYVWREEFSNGKHEFNLRNDDLAILFQIMEDDLDIVYSQVIDADNMFTADNPIFRAQGVLQVQKRILLTINKMYPVVAEKGGQQNIDQALKYIDEMANFEPSSISFGLFYTAAAGDPDKFATILNNYRQRLTDLSLLMDK